MSTSREVYYRYTDWWTGTENNDPCVKLNTYPVLRHTKCGVWIMIPYSKEKFVLKGSGRRFAYSEEKDALHSYKIRKNRQHARLVDQIEATRLRMTQMGMTPP